jgi:hypothetical protein
VGGAGARIEHGDVYSRRESLIEHRQISITSANMPNPILASSTVIARAATLMAQYRPSVKKSCRRNRDR